MPSSPTSVQEQTTWGRKPIGDQLRSFDLGIITGFVPTIVLLFDRTVVRIGDPTGGAPRSSREAARRGKEPGSEGKGSEEGCRRGQALGSILG